MRMCGLVSNCLSVSLRYHILYLSPECQYFVHQCKLMTLAQHFLIIELLINHIPLSMKLSVETVRDMKLTKTGSYQTFKCQKIVQYCFFCDSESWIDIPICISVCPDNIEGLQWISEQLMENCPFKSKNACQFVVHFLFWLCRLVTSLLFNESVRKFKFRKDLVFNLMLIIAINPHL